MKRLLFLPFLLLFAGCGVAASSRAAAPAPPTATRTVAVPKPKAVMADRVIATRKGMIDSEAVQLAITQLQRAGATTSLGIRLTTYSGYPIHVGAVFDDGETQPIRGSDSAANGSSLDGIYLVERTRAQKYLVARDSDNRCICDAGLDHTAFDGGAPLTLSATYGAPPPDVPAVDVVIPRFGTFANVPLG
jgi:hypothetical protein